MNVNCLILVRIQLLSLFGFNKTRYSKDKKERTKLLFFGIGIFLIALLFLLYSTLTAIGLVALNMTHAIPGIMLTISGVITLVTTVMKSNGSLFGLKDYDIIMAMPVTNATIITSRISFLYFTTFLFSLIILLPCSIVFGIVTKASSIVWIMLFFSLFLAPLLPLIIGSALGALITAVSVRFRHKNLVSILLNISLVVGILIGSMGMQFESEADLTEMSQQLIAALNQIYPLAGIFGKAINQGSILYFLIFFISSIGAFLIFLGVLSRCYIKINTAVTSHAISSDYKLGELKTSSLFWALYKKEAKRYVSSPNYLLNTFIGMILFILLAIGFAITGPENMEQLANMPGMSSWISSLVPFVPAFFVVISSTTCSSISLEGKSRWILYSIPAQFITIFNAKILWNLTILIPPIIIGGSILSWTLKLGILETFLLFFLPCAYGWFISVVGILLNIKYPNFDFNSDVEVVKRGIPVLLTMLLGIISVLFPIGAVMFLSKSIDSNFIIMLSAVTIMGIGTILYNHLKKIKLTLS